MKYQCKRFIIIIIIIIAAGGGGCCGGGGKAVNVDRHRPLLPVCWL
jgi:hypothetical protein